MLSYILSTVFFIFFTANNLFAQNLTEDPYADLIFPNFSIQVLDEPNYRAFPTQQTEKMFVVIAYVKANWFRAQEICGYQGLSLATINSKDESEAIQNYLTRAGLNLNSESFWLAGSKLADNRNWVWFSTGRPLTFSNWAVGEPNNAGGNEKCLMVRSNGQWNDVFCEFENFVICETRCPLTSYDLPIYTRK